MSAAPFKNIALWGLGGTNFIGSSIVSALLSSGLFHLTVLQRESSRTTYPPSLTVIRIPDTLPHSSLVAALQGQDVLLSAVGHSGILSQTFLAAAAAEAGVRRFIPSEFGFDNGDPLIAALSPIFRPKHAVAQHVESLAATHPSFSWTGIATGLWLDWALDLSVADIDPHGHKVAYWDAGDHAPSMTTLAYAAQAVVEVLKAGPEKEEFRNRRVFLQAFAASQRDVVAELEGAQGVRYEAETKSGVETVRWTEEVLKGGFEEGAAMTTVSAELWMERYGAAFVKAGKGPMLEDLVEMPKITLAEVVREFVARQGKEL